MQSYGIDELIHDGDWYDRINTFDFDLPFYRKWAKQVGGPVLELCCGTGRLTIPLAVSGIDITGLDISEVMLKRARKKAEETGVSRIFHQGDMRSFDMDQRFKMVFIPFNSLQGIYTIDDVERVFQSVKRHLAPDGFFVFDVFNPDFRYMLERGGDPVMLFQFELDDGTPVVIRETCMYDSRGQVNRVTWYQEVNGITTKARLDMRCFYPQELMALLKYNGFVVNHLYGNFDESDFQSVSPKQIVVCQMVEG